MGSGCLLPCQCSYVGYLLVEDYLTTLMNMELTVFLGRDRCEGSLGDTGHRNGSYGREFLLKKLGEVDVRVPP